MQQIYNVFLFNINQRTCFDVYIVGNYAVVNIDLLKKWIYIDYRFPLAGIVKMRK